MQSQVAEQDSKQAETGPPKALKVKLKTAASKQGDILTEGTRHDLCPSRILWP